MAAHAVLPRRMSGASTCFIWSHSFIKHFRKLQETRVELHADVFFAKVESTSEGFLYILEAKLVMKQSEIRNRSQEDPESSNTMPDGDSIHRSNMKKLAPTASPQHLLLIGNRRRHSSRAI